VSDLQEIARTTIGWDAKTRPFAYVSVEDAKRLIDENKKLRKELENAQAECEKLRSRRLDHDVFERFDA
jgi:hypothetical protein